MKVQKLSGAQTTSLEAMGVDVEADVLIPFGKGPGLFSHCEFCFHQRFIISGNEAKKVCGNPVVKDGLQGCFYMNKEGDFYDTQTVES
jgi:hypothetical protein